MATLSTPRVASQSASPAASPHSSTAPSIKSYYRNATSSFLVRDYAQTSQALHSAQHLLPASSTSSSAWITSLSTSNTLSPKDEWARKLTIFEITFLATCRSHPPQSNSVALHPAHQRFVDLPIDSLIPSLWSQLILHKSSAGDSAQAPSTEILASPLASSVHPSLVVALALAALKLDQPRQARAALESYLGSISVELEALLEEGARFVDWSAEFTLDETMSGSTNLSSSAVLGANDSKKALLASWLKVVDLLSLHVLPRLGEWEAAGDFIRMQSAENGGWIGDVRVEAALQQLSATQREELEQLATRAQRQREQKEAAAAAATLAAQQQQSARRARTSDKGKARATTETVSSRDPGESSSTGSSPTGSPGSKPKTGPSRRPNGNRSVIDESSSAPRETGFAAMRSSLSSYLSQSVPNTASSTSAISTNESLPAMLLANLRTHDPVRLLSAVCFAFAFITWVRRTTARRRANGKSGLGIGESAWMVLGKLGEVVKMGTKVTQL